MASDVVAESGLRTYLNVLVRRKRAIILCTVLAACGALVWSLLQSPRYASRAQVLLQPRSNESLFDAETGTRNDPVRNVQTEIAILESESIRSAVGERIGSSTDVSVRPLGLTDLIEIEAVNGNRQRAAEVANAYADAYIDFRRTRAVDDVLAAAEQIRARIDDLQKQVAALDPALAAGAAPAAQAQRDSLVAQQALLRQKLDQLQVDAALKTGGAQLVTRATASSSPVTPRPARDAVVGAVMGLILGIGVAFLLDHFDDSIKSKADLERASPRIPVLGLIPAVNLWKGGDGAKVISLEDSTSPAAEAYRTLRTSIEFLAVEQSVHLLQVTSPDAGEGKSSTCANLGVALARADHRVVIVSCDLRRPRIHEFFGLDNEIGFTSVVMGTVPLSAALQPVKGQPGLWVLTSGWAPHNPSELLGSMRTVDVLTSLKAETDVVLIDSPPVLPVADALVLSGRVDATLVVALAGLTTRKELSRAVELLRQVHAPIVGAVLNGVTAEGSYGYNYRQTRYEQPQSNGRGWVRHPGARRERRSPAPR